MVEQERALLSEAGHAVIPYDTENRPGLAGGLQFAASPWNLSAANDARAIVETTGAQIAHVHNTWFASSPAILRTVAQRTPVVMTLHNYRITCIAATLSRNNSPCHLCVGGSGWSGVRYRCYRNSTAASLIAHAAATMTRSTAARYVSRFAVLTEFARDIFEESGVPADRMIVVPNFTRDPGSRSRPPSAGDSVLFVGRLSEEKGVDVLLRAWTIARPGLRLQVVGTGPLEQELKTEYPDIEFLGHTPASEVRARLLEARAVVFPSQCYEGQSLVLLEAMAAGLPVLASGWSPIRQTLRGVDEEWFVSPSHVHGWAERLKVLESDHAVDSAGSALRISYESTHAPAAALARLEGLYRSVLE